MGGDCAESFDEFCTDHVRDTMRVILQMALTITYGSSLPVVKIGRMAGQFAKPRSSGMETRVMDDGTEVSLPSYKGDNINVDEFTLEARTPDPELMVKGTISFQEACEGADLNGQAPQPVRTADLRVGSGTQPSRMRRKFRAS